MGFGPEALRLGAAALFSLPLQIGAVRLGTLDLHRATPGDLSRDQLADALTVASLGTEILLELAGHAAPGHDAGRTADSAALLDALWAHAIQDRFVWCQEWQPGDMVMWDNRCVMHRRDAFDESLRRLMHRTQIVGEPVLAG